MGEFTKSDAIDYAHALRLLVNALVAEGFGVVDAETHVFKLMEQKVNKNKTCY